MYTHINVSHVSSYYSSFRTYGFHSKYTSNQDENSLFCWRSQNRFHLISILMFSSFCEICDIWNRLHFFRGYFLRIKGTVAGAFQDIGMLYRKHLSAFRWRALSRHLFQCFEETKKTYFFGNRIFRRYTDSHLPGERRLINLQHWMFRNPLRINQS